MSVVELLEETDPRVKRLFARYQIAADVRAGTGSVYGLHADGTIEPFPAGDGRFTRVMSKFNPTDTEQVVRWLRTETRQFGRPLPPIPKNRSFVYPVIAVDRRAHLLRFVFRTDALRAAWTSNVWIDSPDPDEHRRWTAELMETVLRIVPNAAARRVCAHGKIGALSSDGAEWKWGPCPICFVPEERRKKREARRMCLTETQEVDQSSARLRAAMHRAYDGKCQLCSRVVDLQDAEVDHILPRSKPIALIRAELLEQGDPAEMVDGFVARHWHGTHDCVLNYTLMCKSCNGVKTNAILSPLALERLLLQSRRQARQVVDFHNGGCQ